MPHDSPHRYYVTKGGLLFLALAVFVYVGAFNTDINLLSLICATMTCLFAVSFVAPYFTLRGLTARRAAPAEAYAREPMRMAFRVRNPRTNASRSVTAEDVVLRGGRVVLRPRAWGARVNGQGEATLAYRMELPARGVYALRGPSLSSGFPFGLAGGYRPCAEEQELAVYPARGRLKKNLNVALSRSRSLVGSVARRAMGEEEFRSLREYVAGDNPRRIHWRTTARQGSPYVREMEWAQESSLLILVDTAAAPDDHEALGRLELGLCFAAEVARQVVREGGIVRLAAYGPDLVVTAPVGDAHDTRIILEAMARFAPAPDKTLGQLAGEKRVGFEAAGRRLVVALTAEAGRQARQRGGSGAVEVYVAGSRRFMDTFELTPPPPAAAGVFRVEGGAAP